MKNRKTAWILLPGVLLIWGFLGWKLYAAINSNDEVTAVASDTLPVNQVQAAVPDTYQLLLDYPDPFLGSKLPTSTNYRTSDKHSTTSPKETPHIPEITVAASWPDVAYSGLVFSQSEGKMLGFLTIDGKSNFVQNGDVIGEVVVKKLWKDSVSITWNKQTRVFRK